MTKERYIRMIQLKMMVDSIYGLEAQPQCTEELFQEYMELLKEFQECKSKIDD